MCDHEDGFDGMEMEDIGLGGALAEEMAGEDRKRQWLLKQVQPEEDENIEM